MNRKIILCLLTIALLSTVPLAGAQQRSKKVPRIGFLCAMNGPSPHTEAFLQGLQELGYVAGKNIHIEYRFTKGKVDPFPQLAAELAAMNLDAIITASPPAIQPAINATRKIPIVMAQSDDPVRSGFVASLARPGGNVTGLSSMAPELSSKQLELLKEAFPKINRVGLFRDAANAATTHQLKETEATARALGIRLLSLGVRAAEEVDRAFDKIKKERVSAFLVSQDMLFFEYQSELANFASKSRLPSVYAWRAFVEGGGLMAYGPSDKEMFRRAATYVDKILKGTKPADLPVEQPTKFELVINLKAAKQIGLTIPPNVLARADNVIR